MLDPETGKYIPTDAERRLIDALRSGAYRQTHNRLAKLIDGNWGFCCLGVACEISRMGEWADTPFGPVFTHAEENQEGMFLTPQVRRWLGWATDNGVTCIPYPGERYHLTCAGMNDGGLTFSQIADVIEAGLVFHEGDDPNAEYLAAPQRDDS